MIKGVASTVLRFIVLWVIQVFIIVHLNIHPLFQPQVYLLAILVMPIAFSRMWLLVIAFVYGLSIDIAMTSPGLHCGALVAMVYLRHYFILLLTPRAGYDFGIRPGFKSMGSGWMISYLSLCIAAHHFVLFSLEYFEMSSMWTVILKSFGSGILTLLLVMIGILLETVPKRSR